MDNFELKPERKVNRKPLVWNFLTVVVLLGIYCLATYFLTIFNNPHSPFNPFPPAPLATLYHVILRGPHLQGRVGACRLRRLWRHAGEALECE